MLQNRQLTRYVYSLVPRPLFSIFICGGGKKGLVDLHRTFCSTDSQIWESLIGVDNYKGLIDEVSITIVSCSYVIRKIRTTYYTQLFLCKRSIRFISLHQQTTRTYVQRVPTNLQLNRIDVLRKMLCTSSCQWFDFDKCSQKISFTKLCFSYLMT